MIRVNMGIHRIYKGRQGIQYDEGKHGYTGYTREYIMTSLNMGMQDIQGYTGYTGYTV